MVTGVKISELTEVTDFQDADYIPILRSNGDSPETFTNKKIKAKEGIQLKYNQPIIITLPDADYTLTEDESGYATYFFISTALTATRTVTLDPAYKWNGGTMFLNGFTSETLDITYDGGTPITLAANEGCVCLTAAAYLTIFKTGSSI
jgi:hypothetical protein